MKVLDPASKHFGGHFTSFYRKIDCLLILKGVGEFDQSLAVELILNYFYLSDEACLLVIYKIKHIQIHAWLGIQPQ